MPTLGAVTLPLFIGGDTTHAASRPLAVLQDELAS